MESDDGATTFTAFGGNFFRTRTSLAFAHGQVTVGGRSAGPCASLLLRREGDEGLSLVRAGGAVVFSGRSPHADAIAHAFREACGASAGRRSVLDVQATRVVGAT